MVRGIKRQQRLADRSMFWLKEQYTQLYFEDGCCCEPLAADAIRMFGGRDWATGMSASAANIQPGESVDNLRREASLRFKKKRSVVNLLTQGGGSSSSGGGGSGSGSGGLAGISSSGMTPVSSCTGLSALDSESTGHRTEGGRMRSAIEKRRERNNSSDQLWQNVKHLRAGSITYETQLDFLDFVALFRSFSLLARKDLRDLFDQLSVARHKSKSNVKSEKSRSAPELCSTVRQRKIGNYFLNDK